ncbi:MAG: hypothetical protein R3C03_19630 [Pirellulaceae bacterium]
MIQVVPPDDWNPESEQIDKPAGDNDQANEVARAKAAPSRIDSEDFADIEKLIREQEEGGNALPVRTSPQIKKPTSKPQAVRRPSTSPQNHQTSPAKNIDGQNTSPVAGQNWVNPETQKRQRTLMIVSGVVVGLLLLGGGGYAFVSWITKQTDADSDLVANNVPDVDVVPNEESLATSSLEPPETSDQTNQGVESHEPSTEIGGPPAVPANPPSGQPDQDPVPVLPTQLDLETPSENSNTQDTDQQSTRIPANPLFNLERGLDRTPAAEVAPVVNRDEVKVENVMSQIAPLISDAGTTFDELNQLAIGDVAKTIGLGALYIAKPDNPPTSRETVEAFQLPRVKYDSVPLNTVIAELTELTGIPVAFSRDAIDSLDLEQTVTSDLKSVSLITLLNELFSQQQLVARADEYGVLIDVPNAAEPVDRIYDFPSVPDLDDERRANFVQSIKHLIAPDSWLLQDKTSIEIVDGKIHVKQFLETQREIKYFIGAIDQALQFNRNEVSAYQPLFASADAELDRPIDMRKGIAVSLFQYVSDINSQSSVKVYIDWASIARDGWTAETTVPRFETFASVRETLDALCSAMELNWEVVAADAVFLTTRETIELRRNVEVYPVGKLIDAGRTSESILTLLDQTVGNQMKMRGSGITASRDYDPTCRGVIVFASQTVQRQVKQVLDRVVPE